MTSKSKASALILLTSLVAGCSHKAKTTPPPAAQAPVAPVSTLAKQTPPPQLPPPSLPQVSQEPAKAPPEPKPHKSTHHKPKTTETTPAEQTAAKDQATPPPATEQAATGTGADVSPIGQLSEAGESTNTPKHHELLDEINATETGLNNIKRTLSPEEQTTATQIRTFLVKAKDALNQEDLDGANTLVTKAKVLLAELTKE